MNTTECKCLISVFEDRYEARRAVDELEQAGFSHDQVGFAIRGEDAVAGGMITDAVGAKDKQGAIAGASIGAVAGGILGAAAAAVIPGFGPVVAAGILTTALGGAAAGAATGGILGALAGLGVSEEEARFYETEFASGKAIVTVRSPGERTPIATRVMQRHGGYDFQCRGPAMRDPSSLNASNSQSISSSERRG